MVTRDGQKTWYGRQHEQSVDANLTLIHIGLDRDEVLRVVPTV
jgi:hypothetical protein